MEDIIDRVTNYPGYNEQTNCQIGEILSEHKIPLDTIDEVEKYIHDYGYNGCKWCLEEYHTD